MAVKSPRRRTAAARQTADSRTKTTLVLSAGAPNALLMAGVLCAVWEQGKTFDIIYTTGGSAFLGLVYAAPRGKEPNEALRGLVDVLSVSDAIFRLCPMNYKVFTKAGPFTEPIRRLADRFKIPAPAPGAPRDGRTDTYRRLYNDLVDMGAALVTPTTVNYWSKGICDPFPFLADVVDFAKLKRFPGSFYMNAFNVTREEPQLFSKEEIDVRHFLAALAYPFMYPPVEIDGNVYFEGADWDPVNFGNFLTRVKERDQVKTLVLMDILASLKDDIIKVPANLWEAYGMSIITPAVSLAEKCIELFEKVDNLDADGQRIHDVLKIRFDIPAHLRPHIMDWSYSNLSGLFDAGYRTGLDFVREHGDILPAH